MSLFWTTGKWEVGNTIELSWQAKLDLFIGYTAEIKKITNSQFNIVDFQGNHKSKDCDIQRENNPTRNNTYRSRCLWHYIVYQRN